MALKVNARELRQSVREQVEAALLMKFEREQHFKQWAALMVRTLAVKRLANLFKLFNVCFHKQVKLHIMVKRIQ